MSHGRFCPYVRRTSIDVEQYFLLRITNESFEVILQRSSLTGDDFFERNTLPLVLASDDRGEVEFLLQGCDGVEGGLAIVAACAVWDDLTTMEPELWDGEGSAEMRSERKKMQLARSRIRRCDDARAGRGRQEGEER